MGNKYVNKTQKDLEQQITDLQMLRVFNLENNMLIIGIQAKLWIPIRQVP